MEIKITFEGKPEGFPWEILLNWVPHLFWGAVLLVTFFVIGPKTIRDALSRATRIGIAGFEVELGEKFDAIARSKNIALPSGSREQLVRRIEKLKLLITSSKMLWIDDHPSNNSKEIEILRQLGASIDLASTDDEARQRLSGAVYDIVFSDMKRGKIEDAGIKILPEIKAAISSPPVIFYVGRSRDVPLGAFGLTTRPDELLNLTMDAIERRRG
jgi:CheY-like chemotaxis protein